VALARRLQFGWVSQHVLGRCDGTDLATADDVAQVFAHLEPHEAGADEPWPVGQDRLGGGQASATYFAQFPGPHHKLEGDHLLVGVTALVLYPVPCVLGPCTCRPGQVPQDQGLVGPCPRWTGRGQDQGCSHRTVPCQRKRGVNRLSSPSPRRHPLTLPADLAIENPPEVCVAFDAL